jgi:hypothetical protein
MSADSIIGPWMLSSARKSIRNHHHHHQLWKAILDLCFSKAGTKKGAVNRIVTPCIIETVLLQDYVYIFKTCYYEPQDGLGISIAVLINPSVRKGMLTVEDYLFPFYPNDSSSTVIVHISLQLHLQLAECLWC